MTATRAVIVRCAHPSDRTLCWISAEAFARSVGLGHVACWEVAISVAELVSNALRHAGAAELTLRLDAGARPAIEVVVRDEGPGIADVERAMTDGWSEGRQLAPGARDGRGLGMGLGAVRRLMDELAIETSPRGTTVTARKWLRRAS